MATEKDMARRFPPQGLDRRTQAGLIQFAGSARGRPVRPLLPEGQVATQDDPTSLAERIRQSDQ